MSPLDEILVHRKVHPPTPLGMLGCRSTVAQAGNMHNDTGPFRRATHVHLSNELTRSQSSQTLTNTNKGNTRADGKREKEKKKVPLLSSSSFPWYLRAPRSSSRLSRLSPVA